MATPDDHSLRDVDLHVHTFASKCGYVPPRRLLELTRAAGRRVVAVTDHDSAEGAVAVRDLAARTGDDLMVLVGMELTTSDLGHVVLFGRGVEDDWGWQPNQPFPRDIPDHWLAIQAHPFRGKVMQNGHGLEVERLPALPERIDAVEVWNAGDVLKKTPGLRAALDRVSWDYVREHGKTAVASSDGHRPLWVHSFFTRTERPLESVDDLVAQVRGGRVSPQMQDEAHLEGCRALWRRRAVIEWHEAGLDWRARALADGYTPEQCEQLLDTFTRVRDLSRRGATVGQVAGETGLTAEEAADFLHVVEEETGWAERRAGRVPGTGFL
jgi:hypothetical protein